MARVLNFNIFIMYPDFPHIEGIHHHVSIKIKVQLQNTLNRKKYSRYLIYKQNTIFFVKCRKIVKTT